MTMLARLVRNRQGSSTVEIALAAPIIFTLLFGIIEFGRAYWTRTALQFAAEESGRYAMAHRTASTTAIKNYFTSNLSGVDKNTVTVQVTSQTVDGVPYTTIVGQVAFVPLSFLNVGQFTLEGRSRVPVVN